MRCTTRALSLTSLGFGLVATGALSLAVATDYWLFTVEPVIPDIGLNDTAVLAAAYDDDGEELEDASRPSPVDADALLPVVGPDGSSMLPIVISMHSGLWRLCIINDPPGECIRRSTAVHLFMIGLSTVNVSFGNSSTESATLPAGCFRARGNYFLTGGGVRIMRATFRGVHKYVINDNDKHRIMRATFRGVHKSVINDNDKHLT